MHKWLVLLFSVTVFGYVQADINLTSLRDNGIQYWQAKVFSTETMYTLGNYKGRLALKALSNNSASGFVLKKRIDLTITPYLSWSWLAEKNCWH